MSQRAEQPGKPILWRDRLQRLKRLTPEAAPFFLRPAQLPDGSHAFVEREWLRADEVIVLSAAGLFFGTIAALIAVISLNISGRLLAGATAAVLLLSSAYAFPRAIRDRGRWRTLRFDPSTASVIVETRTRRGRIIRCTETPIDDCALLLHPVGTHQGGEGDAAIVHLGEAAGHARFVLAYGTRTDVVAAYIDDCPGWLRDIYHGDGPLLVEYVPTWVSSRERRRLDRGHCPRCDADLSGRFITGCSTCDT